MRPRILCVIATVFASASGLAACSHTIMRAPLVSMTLEEPPPKGRSVSAGKVNVKWCRGDPSQTGNTAIIGLIDEVTMLAQRRSKADYLRNATFVKEGGSCITVSGEAMRVKK